MKRKTIIILAAILAVTLATSALAQTERPLRGLRGQIGATAPDMPQLDRMLQRLDLSEDQQAAIEKLQTAARKEGVELRKQLQRARHELQGEMLKDSPSERTVVQLTERVGELRTKLQVLRVKTRLAVRAQLTAEQRDELLLCRDGEPRHRQRGGDFQRERRGRGPRFGR